MTIVITDSCFCFNLSTFGKYIITFSVSTRTRLLMDYDHYSMLGAIASTTDATSMDEMFFP